MKVITTEIANGIHQILVYPGGKFGYGHFLIKDQSSALIHCGRKTWYPQLSQQVDAILNSMPLKYLLFSHFEADEVGAANLWKSQSKDCLLVSNKVGLASVEEFIDNPYRVVDDDDVIDLGEKKLQILLTPHFPHGWDGMVFYEQTTKTLFSSDFGANLIAVDGALSFDGVMALQKKLEFMPSESKHYNQALEKMRKLEIERLACHHGKIIDDKAIIARLLSP